MDCVDKGILNVSKGCGFKVVTFSSDFGPSPFLFAYLPLSSTILICFPYHMQITLDCPFPFPLSLITSIVDCPLHYLVADSLLPYPGG